MHKYILLNILYTFNISLNISFLYLQIFLIHFRFKNLFKIFKIILKNF